MTILHIASINEKKSNGMNMVIPEHVKNQNKFENVAMFSCNNYIPENSGDNYKVFFKKNYKKFDLDKLESPFNKPDIVIFHGIYIYNFIKIYKNILKHNIPYIIIPHGSLTKQAQKVGHFKKIVGNILLYNKFIKNASYIQYLSETEKTYSTKYKIRSFVLGNGIYVPDKLLRNYNSKKDKDIVYIGRMDRYHKGLDILIEAAAIIQNEMRNKNISISLYGPPRKNEIEILRNLISKNKIDDIIQVKGYRSFWSRKRTNINKFRCVYTTV